MAKKEISKEVLHKRQLNKLTVNELVHWWCNNKIEIEYDRGDYTFTPDKFYLNNKQKAQIYNGRLILTKFDDKKVHQLNDWSFKAAFPKDEVHLFINPPFHLLDKQYQKENPDIIINFITKEIIDDYQNYLNRISYYKEVIENNRILGLNSIIRNLIYINPIEHYEILFDKELLTKTLDKKVTYTTEYRKYNGWGKSNYETLQTLKHEHSINEIINKGLNLYFTDEQIEILKLKHFLYSYCRIENSNKIQTIYRGIKDHTSISYTISLKDAKLIWFSDKKEEWKQEQINRAAEENRRKEEKYLKEKEEKLKEALLKINNFRNGSSLIFSSLTSSIYDLGYTILRFGQASMGNVIDYRSHIESSLGMRIEIEEAKKALQLFRIKETKHDLVQGFKYNGIIKRTIPYLDENANVQYREEDCISIGCHTVPESEIKAFLEYYKLDW